MFETYKPEGFHTVMPYLFVEEPEKLVEFLKNVFYAKEINRSLMPNGDIGNVILKIGDSCFMISQARGEFEKMRTALYLYVSDVDALHKRAVDHGAEVCFEPDNMPYGDRQSGIVDPCGNYWWISKRMLNKGYEE